MQNESSKAALMAIYGNPASNGASVPVGGGLGRDFGFGETMLFQASTTAKIGKNFHFAFAKETWETSDMYIGATLASNKTGKNQPLGLTIQFVDPQGTINGGKTSEQLYADTFDRPWIAAVCSPETKTECRTDAQYAPTGAGGVEIEDASLNLGPGGFVLQGTLWGKFRNGAAKQPPCITFESPPAAGDPSLVITQGASVGATAESVGGEACLISAGNDWYEGSEANEPAITIGNTE